MQESITKETTEIEVEVLEIDGLAPVKDERPAAEEPLRWRNLQGRVLKLDPKWWPLWLFLGVILLFLLLTVGLVLGVLYVVLRLVAKVLRAIMR